MPVHDWTLVDAALFHDFHQSWTVALRDRLNTGLLPPDYFALLEQKSNRPSPEVSRRSQAALYARRAIRITVRRSLKEVIAVIEIVSPGDKLGRSELRALVGRSTDGLRQGVHLLLIDLFPPGAFDLQGLHQAI
jgi:hypothetical protein